MGFLSYIRFLIYTLNQVWCQSCIFFIVSPILSPTLVSLWRQTIQSQVFLPFISSLKVLLADNCNIFGIFSSLKSLSVYLCTIFNWVISDTKHKIQEVYFVLSSLACSSSKWVDLHLHFLFFLFYHRWCCCIFDRQEPRKGCTDSKATCLHRHFLALWFIEWTEGTIDRWMCGHWEQYCYFWAYFHIECMTWSKGEVTWIIRIDFRASEMVLDWL